MGALWLPEDVEREQQIDSALIRAIHGGKKLDRELKKLDPHLSCVLASQNATSPDLEPGHWHIRRENPGFEDSYIALKTPEGNPAQPGDWVIEWLKSRDLWNNRISEYIRGASAKRRAAAKRQEELDQEGKKDNAAAAVRAANRLRGDAGMQKNFNSKRAGKGLVGS